MPRSKKKSQSIDANLIKIFKSDSNNSEKKKYSIRELCLLYNDKYHENIQYCNIRDSMQRLKKTRL